MLLTSGQVSVAISSFIVFFFTTALFLSGYVLQQQTVRDLREAIKPQFQAKLWEEREGGGFSAEEVRGRGGLEEDAKVEIKRDMEAGAGVGGGRKKVKKARGGGNMEWSEVEERVSEAQKESAAGDEMETKSIDDAESVESERAIKVPEKPMSLVSTVPWIWLNCFPSKLRNLATRLPFHPFVNCYAHDLGSVCYIPN
ncbi:hypothetical protein EYC84_008211 [Monilinia fructicola]|uniref:Uncharacterized protein n=1 Tax=Monilinia fructicola TaxID=38448 RepID=A0A5M9JGF3_MONFR|nr:hypothetical protein EYC84_008211 [Monilinia fructicola]